MCSPLLKFLITNSVLFRLPCHFTVKYLHLQMYRDGIVRGGEVEAWSREGWRWNSEYGEVEEWSSEGWRGGGRSDGPSSENGREAEEATYF